MSSDAQLQALVHRLLSGLRGQLETGLRTYADELGASSAAERARAIAQATEDARRQAQEQLTQLREAARKQHDDLRRSAEIEISELRRLLDDLRRNAQQQIETAWKTLEKEMAAVRARAASEIEHARRSAQSQVQDVQRATDNRLKEVARERDELKRERDAARQQLADEQQRASSHDASAERHLRDEIAAIDESASLGQVVDRLVDAAERRGERIALLMRKGDEWRAWRRSGFAAGTESAGSRPFGVHDDGLAVFPVIVAGSVVAILHVEFGQARGDSAKWAADLEILTRHAGRVLESLTIHQAAGMRPATPVARPSHLGSVHSASGGPS